MIKVRATKASRIYNKALKEFHRIVEEGEEFEVTEERFAFLNGGNSYSVVFVEAVEDKQIEKPAAKPKPKKQEKVKVEEVVVDEIPDIFVIEPGEEPVQVDENLQPIKQTSKKKKSKKSCAQK